nr:hypothetical protein [Tanacetum cinerariifolium]
RVHIRAEPSPQQSPQPTEGDVARSHDGDGGGVERPLHTMYPAVAWVALLTEAKVNESPIWAAGQRAGSIPATRPETFP